MENVKTGKWGRESKTKRNKKVRVACTGVKDQGIIVAVENWVLRGKRETCT